MNDHIKLAPSILAADFARLGVAGTAIFNDRQGIAAAIQRLRVAGQPIQSNFC
jgi:pentose-5-phosphate-3-epimerase